MPYRLLTDEQHKIAKKQQNKYIYLPIRQKTSRVKMILHKMNYGSLHYYPKLTVINVFNKFSKYCSSLRSTYLNNRQILTIKQLYDLKSSFSLRNLCS